MRKYSKMETVFDRAEDFTVDLEQVRLPEFAMIPYWTLTEKLDGTNIRIHWEDGRVIFGGRTDKAQVPTDLLEYLQETFTPRVLEGIFPEGAFTLFGEGIGGRIQKAGPRYGPVRFALFDVWASSMWLEYGSVKEIAMSLGVESAPVIMQGASIMDAVELVREGFTSRLSQDVTLPAEGVVARTDPTLLTRRGRRIIWKLKAKDFTPSTRGRRHGKR